MIKKQIIDCFTFFNELDMLEFRLTELDPYVDKFVIIESTKTFTGKPKPLYYNINKFKYKKWQDKIVHKIVYDMPVSLPQNEIDKLVDLPEIRDMNWVREHHQRRQIGKVLEKMNLDYEDVILVSDLDEIPNLKNSESFIKHLKYGPVVFEQDWYIWNLHNFKNSNWRGGSAFYYSHYINNKDIFQKIRNKRWNEYESGFTLIKNGWHFSWFGNQEFIKQKMFSFAHTETANEFFNNKENITYLVENSLPPQVPTEHTKKLNFVEIDPNKLPDNYEIIPHHFSKKTKIFDCFMFFNELDVLDLRLHELNPYVDYFIIIESQKTHSGKPKDLYYQNNIERFQKFEDKIIYVVIEDLPNKLPQHITDVDLNWYRENFQRNQIKTSLMQIDISDRDIVMISDVDEIPDLTKVNLLEITPSDDFITCQQRWFNWSFDWEFEDKFWPGTQITKWSYLQNTTPQSIRNQRYDENKIVIKEPWGWHLSWFGDNNLIHSKLDSFAHQEIEGINSTIIDNKRQKGEALVTEKLIKLDWDYYPKNKDILVKKQKDEILIDFE
jgi:beta-1,4-mannosyl-glycoprotein beta-1,4-N-acetylglucosaminyltransferase